MNSQGQAVDSTQPISQSFYDSIIKKGKSIALLNDQDETLETQRTLREGENGHVDIMSSFVTGQEGSTAVQDSEPVDFSPTQTQHQLTQFAESQRFKTPATSGRKRKHNGDLNDTPARPKNPLLRNGEPTPGRLMGLSQAFAGTQAPSSPMSNGLPTGPRSDRPSPSIELQTRLASLADSSPLRPISDYRKAATQPAARYVPLKQSQAERELHAQYQKKEDTGQEESQDDEFEDDPSYILRMRKMQDREERVNEELRRLSSPIQPEPDTAEEGPSERRSSESPDLDRPRSQTTDLTSENEGFHQQSEDETDREDELRLGEIRAQLIREEDKENHFVNVPRTVTSNRLHNAINAEIVQSQSSPSLRYTHDVQPHGLMHSSGPNNIPNSQPGEDVSRSLHPSTNSISLRHHIGTGVTTILQAQNGSHQLEKDQQNPSNHHHGRLAVQKLDRTSFLQGAAGDDDSTSLAEANEPAPEIVSGLRAGGEQMVETGLDSANNHASTVQLAAAYVNNIDGEEDNLLPDLSSQPIATTPPGRRRRRLLDISAEPSPLKSPPGFDADQALELDPDQETAEFLAPSPRRKVLYGNKRRLVADIALEATINNVLISGSAAYPGQADYECPEAAVLDPGPDAASKGEVSAAPESRIIHDTVATFETPMPSSRRSVWDLDVSPVKSARIGKRHLKAMTLSGNPSTSPAAMPVENNVAIPKAAGSAANHPMETMDEEEAQPRPDECVAPNMVFACFNGKVRAYYPARCLGFAASTSKKYQIQWEGYEPDEVDAHGVKALDIRKGDTVKVNLDQFSKTPHVVQGFKDRVGPESEHITNVHGYRTLIVAPKPSKSLPSDTNSQIQREVPVASIYLDNNMWSRMKDRTFTFRGTDVPVRPGHATPVDRALTPNTPSSRNRRQMGLSLGTSVSFGQDGIFAHMAFAISYENPTHKNRLVSLIQSQGGLILNDSFHDLLQPDGLELKDQFRELGFTALVTERHSRKEKYIQALALGLPCLSGSWIEDCVNQQAILSWHTYLLAAGECAKLDGAVRSRVLPVFDPKQIKLRDMLAARPKLLDSKVIVVIGRGKTELKRAPYVWLVRVMGALKVEKTIDAKGVGELMAAEDGYFWVFVEDRDIHSTRDFLQQLKVEARRSSRKSRSSDGEGEEEYIVAGNEAIIQSLILGEVWNS